MKIFCLRIVNIVVDLFNQDDKRTLRLKGVFFTAMSIFASKGTTMLVSIISLPLTINYLGMERFGMMETIVALISIMNFSDMGLGFGLQNRISEIRESKELHKSVSSVFFLLLGVSVLLMLISFMFFNSVNWSNIFNIHSSFAKEEAPLSVIIFFVCFIIQIPFSIVQKVQNGFQEGYLSEIWRSGGNVLGLILLIIVTNENLGVPFIILAIYGTNTLSLIMNFMYYFIIRRDSIFPDIFEFDIRVVEKLYKDGLVFFFLQIATIALISSDRLIISQTLGPISIGIYSVGFRLASIFTTPVDAFVLPLLPAFNDALANDDITWVKKILSKSFTLILYISSIFSILLILFGNVIIKYWISPEFQLSSDILWAFGFYIVFSNLNSMLSYIMLTPTFIHKILYVFILSVFITICLKFILIKTYGVAGGLWSTMISMSIFFFSFSFIKLRKAKFI